MQVRSVVNAIKVRSSIECKVSDTEKTHLLHKTGKIANFIRMNLFFPFKQRRREREGLTSAERFWETPRPDLEFPRKEAIQKHFNRYNQSIVIKVDGKEIRLKCVVIESKGCPKSGALNHLIVQGNTSTLDNNMPGIYPFLDSYMKQKQEKNLPHGRFIIFNHYNNTISKGNGAKEDAYFPGDMDEWGFLFKKAIESFTDQYGKFQLVAAHSLGNIPIVAHLKHLKDAEFKKLFPDTLFLAKGPSSLKEVSKNVPFEFGCYPWGWFFVIGAVLYLLAKLTGWTLELDETIVSKLKTLPKTSDFIKKLKETNLIISEVKHDHYFPGKASLCASKKLDQINEPINLYRISFDIPPTRTTKKWQHNYNPGLLQRDYVYQERLSSQGVQIVHHKNAKQVSENKKDHHMLLKHGKSLIDLVLQSSWKSSLASRSISAKRVTSLAA